MLLKFVTNEDRLGNKGLAGIKLGLDKDLTLAQ
jgi:hypothetical protein